METIRVRQNPIHSTIIDNDIFFVDDYTNGNDSHCQAVHIKQYVLSGKTIGGSGAGDIVDIDSTQTLTNKRLNNPKINSSVNLVSTSEELNKLHNNNITPNDLTALHTYAEKLPALSDLSTSKTVQAQIENIKNMVEASNYYLYHKIFKADNANKTFSYEDILSELNIDKDIYYIVPGSLMVQLCLVEKITNHYSFLNLEAGGTPTCYYEEEYNITADKNIFSKFVLQSITIDNWYNIKIFFKLGLL
jgi:hypothetical protein